MKSEIDRLTKAIDELLRIQKSYPQIKIPELQKKRLITIVLKILKNEGITDEEWEVIKPYNPEDPEQAANRKKKFHDDKAKEQIKATRELNSELTNQIEKGKKNIEKIEQRTRIASADKLPAGGKGEICNKCGKKVTIGDYDEHIKSCKGRK